jgi:hypothetical protein
MSTQNRRITVYEAANVLWFSFEAVRRVLKGNLNMYRIATTFMPCLLSEKQKGNCVTTCQNLQGRLEGGPFIDNHR